MIKDGSVVKVLLVPEAVFNNYAASLQPQNHNQHPFFRDYDIPSLEWGDYWIIAEKPRPEETDLESFVNKYRSSP